MTAGKHLTNRDEIKQIHWYSWTTVLGAEANGIWPKYSDTNDVNAIDANFDGEVMVTGDDFGLVKLFRFPSLKRGEFGMHHCTSQDDVYYYNNK